MYPIKSDITYSRDKLAFRKVLVQRVNEYFSHSKKSIHAEIKLYIKVFVTLFALCFSYYLLIFTDLATPAKIAAAGLLLLAMVSYALNIMHDANHLAYSKNKWVNRTFAYLLDICGVSSYFWRLEHNEQHHRYTNITGSDPDLNHSQLLRFSPHQLYQWFHKYEAYYIWLLYPLMIIRWQIWGDYATLWILYKNKSPFFPTKTQLVLLLMGKFIFYLLAFFIPMMLYPPIMVICCYLLIGMAIGSIIAPIFDVAHINDQVSIISSEGLINNQVEDEYFIHQLKTTSNFSIHNKLLHWCIGGLNFQVEHHLFPYVSHVHYPALSKIVKHTCQEFNVPYYAFHSFWDALKSHHRWLKLVGEVEGIRTISSEVV